MQVVRNLIEVEEMNGIADNATVDKIPGNITIAEFTTKPAAFFDPTWQLAMKIEFYFQYAVIAIGVFGTAANALVLYALVEYHVRETKKRAINLLMINQNLLDLTSCVLLIVTFSVRLGNIYLTGTLGYFLCTILISENATFCTLYASIINLIWLLSLLFISLLLRDMCLIFFWSYTIERQSSRKAAFFHVGHVGHSRNLLLGPASRIRLYIYAFYWRRSLFNHQPNDRHHRALPQGGPSVLEQEISEALDDTGGDGVCLVWRHSVHGSTGVRLDDSERRSLPVVLRLEQPIREARHQLLELDFLHCCTADPVCLLLRSYRGGDAKTDPRDGRTQRGRSTELSFASQSTRTSHFGDVFSVV